MNNTVMGMVAVLARTLQEHPWVVLALLLLLAGLVGLVLGRTGRVLALNPPKTPAPTDPGCLGGLRKDLEAQFGPIDDDTFEDALGAAIQEVLERKRQGKPLESPDKENP